MVMYWYMKQLRLDRSIICRTGPSDRWSGPRSLTFLGPVQDLWHFWDRSEIFNFKADELISYSFVVNQSLNGMNNDGVTVRKVKKDSWRLCYRVLKGLMFILMILKGLLWEKYNLMKKFWRTGPQILYILPKLMTSEIK